MVNRLIVTKTEASGQQRVVFSALVCPACEFHVKALYREKSTPNGEVYEARVAGQGEGPCGYYAVGCMARPVEDR